jgi:hypothetical protein
MEDIDLGSVMMDTTCHTSGCVNENVTHRVQVPINPDGIFRVVCGTCSRAVTDLVEVQEP